MKHKPVSSKWKKGDWVRPCDDNIGSRNHWRWLPLMQLPSSVAQGHVGGKVESRANANDNDDERARKALEMAEEDGIT